MQNSLWAILWDQTTQDGETVVTLNNYMGEMNSESISRFKVQHPN